MSLAKAGTKKEGAKAEVAEEEHDNAAAGSEVTKTLPASKPQGGKRGRRRKRTKGQIRKAKELAEAQAAAKAAAGAEEADDGVLPNALDELDLGGLTDKKPAAEAVVG